MSCPSDSRSARRFSWGYLPDNSPDDLRAMFSDMRSHGMTTTFLFNAGLKREPMDFVSPAADGHAGGPTHRLGSGARRRQRLPTALHPRSVRNQSASIF